MLLLPMGSSTDAAHSINEKLDKRNYIEGTKLLGAYLHYVAEELPRHRYTYAFLLVFKDISTPIKPINNSVSS